MPSDDEKSYGPFMYQGILQIKTEHFPTNLTLEIPSFEKRFRPNVLPAPEQASGVRLGLDSGTEVRRVR